MIGVGSNDWSRVQSLHVEVGTILENGFGTILELVELYRAGSRYEPTQGFELTQGFERTRGGSKNPKEWKICLGVQNLTRGSTFVLGWLYNFL